MVKYYTIYMYLPNKIYREVYKCLDRQKAFEYASREYKKHPRKAGIKYIVYSEWLYTDGSAKDKAEWIFQYDQATKIVEQCDWRE